MWGMGLGFMTAARGACHLRATFYKPEIAGMIEAQSTEGKVAMFVDWEDRLCIMDTLVYCRFYRDLVQWPYITQVVNAALGTDFTEDDLHKVANRIITETHRFNELRGFGREKEQLPKWVTETPMEDTRLDVPPGGGRRDARRVLHGARLGGCRSWLATPAGAGGTTT